MLAIVDRDWSAFVDAVLLEPDVVVGLSPFLARTQQLVLQVFLMIRLVDDRHVVGHATDRYVILMLGDYVIGMIVGLDVIHVIRLRLDRFCNLGYVILVMINLLEWLLIDLQIKYQVNKFISKSKFEENLLFILKNVNSHKFAR